MTYFLISYDVKNASPQRELEVLDSLISLVEDKLAGQMTNHPVGSTYVFSSQIGFEIVRTEVFNWSQAEDVYYVISQVAESQESSPLCRLVANPKHEESMKAVVSGFRQRRTAQKPS